jgi:hypothetical protein
LNTIAIILFSSLLYWNWGGSSPQFHKAESSVFSEKSIAKIHLTQKQNRMLEIEGTFYNGSNNEINIFYKLTAAKSGQSSSTSNQSGSFNISSKEKVVLSKITMNLNKNDLYKIKLKVFENNQIIAEDSATFYGDKIIQY